MLFAIGRLRRWYTVAPVAALVALTAGGMRTSWRHALRETKAPNGPAWAVEHATYAASVVGGDVFVARRGVSPEASAVRLRTQAIGRLQEIAPVSGVDSASAVGVTIHRGEVEERVRAARDGIEQTWTFGSRPRGSGDLLVRVRVDGCRYGSRSARGLTFVDDATHACTTYGDGTWIDANGVRTDVPARFVNGAVELRVAASVVEASAFPAVLDPSVGPEFAMDAPVFTPVTGPDVYEDVEVGYGAGTYLVSWLDSALSSPRQAVRVRASDGVVLDAVPIAINATGPVAIASDGTNFLVAWSGGAARIAIRDGSLLDGPAGFVTPTQTPSVAYVSSTGDYVEGWSAGNNVSQVIIKASNAAVGGASPLTVSGTGQVPTLAAAAGEVLVAWTDQRSGTTATDIFANRTALMANGVPATASNFPVAHSLSPKSFPAAASNGTDYFVAWTGLQLSGTRVRASDGMSLDGTAGIPLSTTSSRARASFDGLNYVVAYQANGVIHLVRVAPGDGSLLDGAPSSGGITVAQPPSTEPAVASSATESLVAWIATGSASVVMASRVRSSDGLLLDGPTGITVAPSKQHTSPGTSNAETAPAVTSDGANYLVSWLDDRTSSTAAPAYGVLVRSSDGALLDTSAFPLPIAPVALAFDGTNYFASGKSSSTRVRRSDGTELDLPTGIAASGQAVGCVAGTCLVVESRWTARGSGSYPTVFFQRVRSSDGALLDPAGGVQLSDSLINSDQVLAVAGSASFLVVWQQEKSLAGATLKYAVIDPLGHVTGPFNLTTGGVFFQTRSVASDGKNFFVVYACDGGSGYGVLATRIRESDGLLLDGTQALGAITLAPKLTTTMTATTFDGQNFVSVYDLSSGLVGARVRPSDGALLDGPAGMGFPVTGPLQGPVAMASSGHGRSMLVYSTGARVHGRLIDEADGSLDAGGGLADGAVNPTPEAGADAQQADGDLPAVAVDAATEGSVVDTGTLDGLSVVEAGTVIVDATTALDATGMVEADGGAALEAAPGMAPRDGSASADVSSADAPATASGGGSGGCTVSAGISSSGRPGSGSALFLAAVALRISRRRPAALTTRKRRPA